jgi:hypothetical protein
MVGLNTLSNKSQALLNSQKQYNPLCKQSQECVGWGADGSTGSPALFPVIELTYGDPAKEHHGFREPVEAVVSPHVSPAFAYSTQAFPEISDFTDYVDTSIRGASPPGGSNGIFGDSFS